MNQIAAHDKTIDVISKAVALLIAAVYGSGFLIVSLSEARYGILHFDLLKPRILASGALFIFLVVVPTLSMRRVQRRSHFPGSYDESWLKWSFDTNRYFNMCLWIAGAAYPLIWHVNFPALLHIRPSGWKVLVFLIMWPISMGLTVGFMHSYKTHPSKVKFYEAIDFVLANILVLYVLHGWVGYATLVYWFFVVGVYSAWVTDRLSDPAKRARQYFELLLILLVTLVASYVTFVYRNLNSSIGGGKLPGVTVHLNKKIPPFPQLQESLFLVDENDAGFYLVVNPADRQAVFVPRASVESIEYKNQASSFPEDMR